MIHSTHVITLSGKEWPDTTIDPNASWLDNNLQILSYFMIIGWR